MVPHGSPQSVLRPNQEKREENIFTNDLPNNSRAYTEFKFGSRDGQDLGQPAMLGSARLWGQSAMFGLNQEHLLFFTSQDRYWNFNFPSCSLFLF